MRKVRHQQEGYEPHPGPLQVPRRTPLEGCEGPRGKAVQEKGERFSGKDRDTLPVFFQRRASLLGNAPRQPWLRSGSVTAAKPSDRGSGPGKRSLRSVLPSQGGHRTHTVPEGARRGCRLPAEL